jgi:hypothetical protein
VSFGDLSMTSMCAGFCAVSCAEYAAYSAYGGAVSW